MAATTTTDRDGRILPATHWASLVVFAWVGVYIVSPVVVFALWWFNRRTDSGEPAPGEAIGAGALLLSLDRRWSAWKLIVQTFFVATALLLAGAAAPAAAAPAQLRHCAVKVDFNLEISSARNMTCRGAARDLRRHRGSIATRFRTPGGFACRRVSGTELAGQWRCVRRSRAYRFEFSD